MISLTDTIIMNENVWYILFSAITALMSILGVWAAKRAMQRGLTYSAMAATLWALVFFAVGRVWHTYREIESLEGEWAEMLEYSIYLCGYLLFIWLTALSGKVKTVVRQ